MGANSSTVYRYLDKEADREAQLATKPEIGDGTPPPITGNPIVHENMSVELEPGVTLGSLIAEIDSTLEKADQNTQALIAEIDDTLAFADMYKDDADVVQKARHAASMNGIPSYDREWVEKLSPERKEKFFEIYRSFYKPKDRGVVGNVIESVKRGAEGVVQNLAGLGDMAAPVVIADNGMLSTGTGISVPMYRSPVEMENSALQAEMDKAREETATRHAVSRQEAGARYSADPVKPVSDLRDGDVAAIGWLAEKGLYGAAQMTPALAGSAAASAALGPIGSGAWWVAQIAPESYNDMVADGIDPEVARPVAVLGAVPEAMLEMLQIKGLKPQQARFLDKVAKNAWKQFLAEKGKDYLKENAEEALQAGTRYLTNALAVAVDGNVEFADIDWATKIHATGVELGQAALSIPFLMGPGAAMELPTVAGVEAARKPWRNLGKVLDTLQKQADKAAASETTVTLDISDEALEKLAGAKSSSRKDIAAALGVAPAELPPGLKSSKERKEVLGMAQAVYAEQADDGPITEEDVALWAMAEPGAAYALLEGGDTSKEAFESVGLYGMTDKGRGEFLAHLGGMRENIEFEMDNIAEEEGVEEPESAPIEPEATPVDVEEEAQPEPSVPEAQEPAEKPLTYEEFKREFERLSAEQGASIIYSDAMEELATKYPEYEARLDQEYATASEEEPVADVAPVEPEVQDMPEPEPVAEPEPEPEPEPVAQPEGAVEAQPEAPAEAPAIDEAPAPLSKLSWSDLKKRAKKAGVKLGRKRNVIEQEVAKVEGDRAFRKWRRANTERTTTVNEALRDFRDTMKSAGIRPDPNMSTDDFGGKMPPGILQKDGVYTWDTALEEAKSRNLIDESQETDPAALRALFVGPTSTTDVYEPTRADYEEAMQAETPEGKVKALLEESKRDVNEAEITTGDLVYHNGEWHKAEEHGEGTDLKDGETVRLGHFEHMPDAVLVAKDDDLYAYAREEYEAQERKARQEQRAGFERDAEAIVEQQAAEEVVKDVVEPEGETIEAETVSTRPDSLRPIATRFQAKDLKEQLEDYAALSEENAEAEGYDYEQVEDEVRSFIDEDATEIGLDTDLVIDTYMERGWDAVAEMFDVEEEAVRFAFGDGRHSRDVVRQLKAAIPGATISKTMTGWKVRLPNGLTIGVEEASDIPVDIDSAMRAYGVSRSEAERMAAGGVAGATIPAGVRMTLPDGRVISSGDIMVLLDPQTMDSTTARHEALHVARQLGLFSTGEGKRIWDALIKKYGSEEAIAEARGEWTGPTGLWERVKQFFSRLVSKLGREWNPDVAMNETFQESFWRQESMPGALSEAKYQIPMFDATAIKNDVVDYLRSVRGAKPIEGGSPESWSMWIDSAIDTLRADPEAGERLVNQLVAKPRNLSPRESALLVVTHRQAYNDYERLADEQIEAHDGGDIVRASELYSGVVLKVAKINQIEEVARRVGTLAGRSLNARKIILAKDFSLKALVRKARVSQGGENVSPQQMAELTKLAKEIERLEKRLADAETKNSGLEKELKKFHESITEEVESERPARKPKTLRKKQTPATKRESAFAELKKARLARGKDWVDDITTKEPAGLKFQLRGVGEKSEAAASLTPEEAVALQHVAEWLAENGASSFAEAWAIVRLHLGKDAADSESAFREIWSEIEESPDFVGVDVDPDNVAQVTRAARAIYRRLVAEGLQNREENVGIVQEAMADVLPTREAAMEALSAYGQYTQQSQGEVERVLRDHYAQLLQITKIRVLEKAKARAEALSKEGLSNDQIWERLNKEGLLLKATGLQRDKPSDIVRRLTAMVNEAKRQLPISSAARAGQLQTALDAAKRAVRNRIADVKFEIEQRERIVRNRTSVQPDAELTALRAELKALLEVHREVVPRKGVSEEQKNAAWERSLDRAIAELERQLASGDFEPKKLVKRKPTPVIAAKLARLDALRKARQAVRDARKPKLSPEEKARRQYEANLRKRIADYKDVLARKDFAPKPKKLPRKLSAEEMRLKRELAETKAEVNRKFDEYRRANMSPVMKGVDIAEQLAHVSRELKSAFDLSGFRQGGLVAYGHPLLAKEAAEGMLKALVSKQSEFDQAESIANDPMGLFGIQAGLGITKNSGDITMQEEMAQGRWGRLIPGVAASERAYTTLLNNLRFLLFKQMVTTLGRGGQVTLDEARVIASYINAATGRADLKAFNKWAAHLNTVFFAPRYVASRIQWLAMPFYLPFTKTSMRVKKAIAMEYARTLTGWAVWTSTLMALGALAAGDDDDKKPTLERNALSSDWMKPKIGDHRIDTTSGISSVIVLATRLARGKIKSPTGKITKLGEGYKPITHGGLLAKFARYKLAPVPGAVVTAFNNFVDPVGNKVTLLPKSVPDVVFGNSLLTSLFAPLSFGEIHDAMLGSGVPQGPAMSLLAFIGQSCNTYGPTTTYLSAKPEDREEVFQKDLKAISFNDPPLGYSRYLTEEQLAEVDAAKRKSLGNAAIRITDQPPKDEEKLAAWQEKTTSLTNELKAIPKEEIFSALLEVWRKPDEHKPGYFPQERYKNMKLTPYGRRVARLRYLLNQSE